MADKLAKLADLKAAIGLGTTGIDAELTAVLEAASAMAETVAGVPRGGLRRQTGIVEFQRQRCPADPYRIGLDCRPLESVSEVIQLYSSGTDAAFTAAADDALTEDDDYVIDSIDLAILARLDGVRWFVGVPRCLRVTYVAGFADPDDAVGGDSIEPPADLQRAVIMQAVMLWNLRGTAGLKGVEAGGASGNLGTANVHPQLTLAASRYRRLIL